MSSLFTTNTQTIETIKSFLFLCNIRLDYVIILHNFFTKNIGSDDSNGSNFVLTETPDQSKEMLNKLLNNIFFKSKASSKYLNNNHEPICRRPFKVLERSITKTDI